MLWYNTNGKESDVVISSRIRFARNLEDYPFLLRMDRTSAGEIIEKVIKALDGKGYTAIDFEDLTPVQAMTFVENHLVSTDFAEGKLPRALLVNEKKSIGIMVCEEDHIRLQCIMSGLSLDEAYKNACEADDILGEKLKLAWDDRLGYLTHCPTNLGTGLRASVMVFLPAMTQYRQIDQLSAAMSKIGLTVRGLYGEGSESQGCLYQISNQITLGVPEETVIQKLTDVISQIIERERKLRSVIKSDSHDSLCDRCMRALGIMKSSYLMTSEEFMKLYSDVRLGISLGFCNNMTLEKLGDIMINIQPATLMQRNGTTLDGISRDRLRAEYLRKELA